MESVNLHGAEQVSSAAREMRAAADKIASAAAEISFALTNHASAMREVLDRLEELHGKERT